MRILYIDCDSLRPDHLGCYGYHRNTSPSIDEIADGGRRFTNYYAADTPCLPSRTGLFLSRFGIHTGVVNHGGLNADPRPQGPHRSFSPRGGQYRSWMTVLRAAGFSTHLISPFPQRHAAWPVLEGFSEWIDTGGNGGERAEVVAPHAIDWLTENASSDDWYLHVNFWDPHTAYDTPLEYGNPFENEPAPDFPDEDTIHEQYNSYGPHSAHEPHAWGGGSDLERTPQEIGSREEFKQWIDGYDVGIRYMDDHIGQILETLKDAGVYEDTLIILTGDHGENQGELNVYGDHQTADDKTCRVPLVVSGPGVEPGVDDGFHYQLDLAPTVTEYVDGSVPSGWDGQSFLEALTGNGDGREYLVVSQGAWACQRAVRWDNYLLIRTYHDGLKQFDPVELYNLETDPHETTNLARDQPERVRNGLGLLEEWVSQRLMESATDVAGGNPHSPRSVTDPLWEVIREGGPYHARGEEQLAQYVDRLRETDREDHADKIATYEGLVPQRIDDYLAGKDIWT